MKDHSFWQTENKKLELRMTTWNILATIMTTLICTYSYCHCPYDSGHWYITTYQRSWLIDFQFAFIGFQFISLVIEFNNKCNINFKWLRKSISYVAANLSYLKKMLNYLTQRSGEKLLKTQIYHMQSSHAWVVTAEKMYPSRETCQSNKAKHCYWIQSRMMVW